VYCSWCYLFLIIVGLLDLFVCVFYLKRIGWMDGLCHSFRRRSFIQSQEHAMFSMSFRVIANSWTTPTRAYLNKCVLIFLQTRSFFIYAFWLCINYNSKIAESSRVCSPVYIYFLRWYGRPTRTFENKTASLIGGSRIRLHIRYCDVFVGTCRHVGCILTNKHGDLKKFVMLRLFADCFWLA